MVNFPIGDDDVDLRVIGAGVRYGWLPRANADNRGWDLDVLELRDLEAFEAAGWRFHPQQDLDWHRAQDMNGGQIEAGLLARHERGGLVILRSHVVVNATSELPPDFFGGDSARKVPLNGNVYDVSLRLPRFGLEELILSRITAFRRSVPGVLAEPLLLYHLTHRGMFFHLAASAVFGLTIDPTCQWHWDTIHLEDAWAAGGKNYGKGVRIGIIDLGFDIHEPQIKSNIAAEKAFVNDSGERVFNATIPYNEHGTLCAGLAGAVLDVDGVNGAAPECTLLLVAVESITSQLAVAKAVQLCVHGFDSKPGADVISCSLGPTGKPWDLSRDLKESIDDAHQNGRPQDSGQKLGTAVIWADFDADDRIPPKTLEAYDGVLCVGQSNVKNERHSCGYGLPGLDLLAPGVNVAGVTGTSTGASCAAPIVAGVAALMLAKRSTLKSSEVAKIITDTCYRPRHPDGPDDDDGWGRLDAAEAVKRA